MVTAKIIKPVPFPNADGGSPVDFPAWVGEAVVGLTLTISPGGEGDCDCLLSDDGDHCSILPDNLVAVLKKQNPLERALEAADWIDYNDFWAGAIRIPAECFDVFPKRYSGPSHRHVFVRLTGREEWIDMGNVSEQYVESVQGEVEEIRRKFQLIGQTLTELYGGIAGIPVDYRIVYREEIEGPITPGKQGSEGGTIAIRVQPVQVLKARLN